MGKDGTCYLSRWPLFWQPLSQSCVTPVGGTLPFLPGYVDKCTQIQDKYAPQIRWDKFVINTQPHSGKTTSYHNQHLVNATWHAIHSCKTICGNMKAVEWNGDAVHYYLISLQALRLFLNITYCNCISDMIHPTTWRLELAIVVAAPLHPENLNNEHHEFQLDIYISDMFQFNFGFHRISPLSAHGKVQI